MPINRETDQDEVYIYNRILLSHKKEWNNAICSNMDGSRDYHIKWSKSEKDKDNMILFICGILKNDKKWTFLPNRNRPTDIKNKLMVTKGERGAIIRSLGLADTHYNI